MNDAIRCLPSEDVRAHLEKLGYALMPQEAACAVWLSNELPLAEKHVRYRALLRETPELALYADLEALIAWEKSAERLFTRADASAPFEATSWHWLETFDSLSALARWLEEKDLAFCIAGRSELPEDGSFRARIGRGGKITRIESENAPRAIMDIWERLAAENLRVPVPFKAGDTLYLYGDESEWTFLEKTPLLLLETDYETGQAICAAHTAGFSVETCTVPYVFLRYPRAGEKPVTNALSCVSEYLRGVISLGELLMLYPSLFQLDTSQAMLRNADGM